MINSLSLKAGKDIGGILTPIQMEEDSDLEIDVDIGSARFAFDNGLDFRPTSPDLSTMLNLSQTSGLKINISIFYLLKKYFFITLYVLPSGETTDLMQI